MTKRPAVHRTYIELTPPLKQAVLDDPSGANINDVIVGKLAARFGVPFEPTGKLATRSKAESMGQVLRMPWALYTKLRRECERTRPPRSLQSLILAELEQSYGQAAA